MIKTFLNTAFNINEVITVDTDNVEINLVYAPEALKTRLISIYKSIAMDLLFDQYNPNSFLIGLSCNRGDNLGINVYCDVENEFLILSTGQYGLSGSMKEGNSCDRQPLVVKTTIKATKITTYHEDYDGEIEPITRIALL